VVDLKKNLTESKPRKVFGANDYLERQEKMKSGGLEIGSSQLHPSSTANQVIDEDFAEFHVKLGSQIGSVS